VNQPIDPANLEFHRLQAMSGWNQARIAKELGVGRITVWRWENNKGRPEKAKLRLFAAQLGVPCEIGPERLMDTGVQRSLETWERDLLDLLRPIPPKERANFTRGLADVIKVLRTPLDYGKPAKKKPAKPAPAGPAVSSPEAVKAAVAAAQKVAAMMGLPVDPPATAGPATPASPPPPAFSQETTQKRPPQKPSPSPS
jgi:transcriptional regulator with XRE-family HTH domain